MNTTETPYRWKWAHAGPGSERADWDHKARPAEGSTDVSPRCRSCGSRVEKVSR